MNKKLLIIETVLSYLTAFTMLIIYFTRTFNMDNPASIGERLLFMSLASTFIYIGGYLLSKDKQKKSKQKIMHNTLLGIFVIYVVMLFSYTLFDSYFGRFGLITTNWSKTAFEFYFKNSFNIIPFKTIITLFINLFKEVVSISTWVLNIFGNLFALTPCAIFIPLIFKEINNIKKLLITVLLISLGIEILQILMLCGVCDIDDVILNVLGAGIMYTVIIKTKLNDYLLRLMYMSKTKKGKE